MAAANLESGFNGGLYKVVPRVAVAERDGDVQRVLLPPADGLVDEPPGEVEEVPSMHLALEDRVPDLGLGKVAAAEPRHLLGLTARCVHPGKDDVVNLADVTIKLLSSSSSSI